MKTNKEKYCEHDLVPVQECTKCSKTFDVLPSADEIKEGNCPHCGAGVDHNLKTVLIREFWCGTFQGCKSLHTEQSEFCRQREARNEREQEVERLKEAFGATLTLLPPEVKKQILSTINPDNK